MRDWLSTGLVGPSQSTVPQSAAVDRVALANDRIARIERVKQGMQECTEAQVSDKEVRTLLEKADQILKVEQHLQQQQTIAHH